MAGSRTIALMRTLGAIALLLITVVVVGTGCKNKGDADAATSDPAAIKAQQDLVARRDALMAERKKLETTLDGIDKQIEERKSKGEDVTDLEKQRAELVNQKDTKKSEESSLETKLDQMAAQGGNDARIAGLERKLQQQITELENAKQSFLKAQAETSRLADKFKESCAGGTTTQILQVAPPKGANYSRTEAEQVYGKAKSAISKKGLLGSDLGAAGALDSQVQAALSKQDWVAAYYAATSLYQQVEAIKIDRAFTDAKYNRLAAAVRKNTDAGVQKQLEDGMQDIVKLRAAGNYNAVNAKLNVLFSLAR
jgi:hypothetical protein